MNGIPWRPEAVALVRGRISLEELERSLHDEREVREVLADAIILRELIWNVSRQQKQKREV